MRSKIQSLAQMIDQKETTLGDDFSGETDDQLKKKLSDFEAILNRKSQDFHQVNHAVLKFLHDLLEKNKARRFAGRHC